MWTWPLCRGAFQVGAVLAALTFASASLSFAEDSQSRDLIAGIDRLTLALLWISVLTFVVVGLALLGTLGWWGYWWLTPVALREVQHHVTYFRKSEYVALSSMHLGFRDYLSAAPASALATVRFPQRGVAITVSNVRVQSDFRSERVVLDPPPTNGETVEVDLVVRPRWWQGLRTRFEREAEVNVSPN